MVDLAQPLDDLSFIEQEENICTAGIRIASNLLESAVDEYFQLREENLIIENGKGVGIVTQVERFFKSILAALKRFQREITDSVNAKLRTAEMKKALRLFHTRAEELKREGKKTVQMANVWGIEESLGRWWSKLNRQANRLIKTRYKHLRAMDLDLRTFNDMIEQAEKEFNEVTDQTITVPIDQAIAFAEDCITKHDPILTSIDSYLKDIEKMERTVLELSDKKEIYGVDILPEKMSAIRRMTTRLANFLHRTVGKKVAKGAAAVVFLCA